MSASFGMTRDWTFVPTSISFAQAWRELGKRALRRGPRPVSVPLRRIAGKGTWALYFIWAPDGKLLPNHEFTIQRLQSEGFRVAVVCATSDADSIPVGLQSVDALYRKGLPGYDFSGYTLGLEEIVDNAEGSDVLVMNDSVFGPLFPVRPLMESAPWDFTGFLAANAYKQHIHNHIQSFAFSFRHFDRVKLNALRAIYPEHYCFHQVGDVIGCQEVPQARIASKAMSVGALWYAQSPQIKDPSSERPLELVNKGFPFLKKSLAGKHASYVEHDALYDCLRKHGHPLPG